VDKSTRIIHCPLFFTWLLLLDLLNFVHQFGNLLSVLRTLPLLFLVGEHKVTLVASSMLVRFLLLLLVVATEQVEDGVTEFVITGAGVGVDGRGLVDILKELLK
jgi:hypothetical protein